MNRRWFFVATLILLSAMVSAQGYETERGPDGPFSFSVFGVTINQGSSLTRESILFNDPSSPVELAAHSTAISYEDRAFWYIGSTELAIKSPVVAVQVRTILYDVFGQHMINLSNLDARDFEPGPAELSAEWRASDNDVAKMLTTVTYVARVRRADGSQWVFDADNLALALMALNLEREIGEGEDE